MVGELPSAAPSKSSASASSGSACMLQKAAVKNCDNQASKVECRACMDTGPKVGWKAGVLLLLEGRLWVQRCHKRH